MSDLTHACDIPEPPDPDGRDDEYPEDEYPHDDEINENRARWEFASWLEWIQSGNEPMYIVRFNDGEHTAPF